MRRTLMLTLAMLFVGVFSPAARAQIRLVGVTGQQGLPEDQTLFEINLTNAATTRLFEMTNNRDGSTIGYNPVDGLLYHMNGTEAYRDTPGHVAYRDNQYMETVNLNALDPQNSAVGIFNANPPPQTGVAVVFGLPAPRPDWVLPVELRTDEQTESSFRERGVDEYHEARGMAWSASENLFYITDENGFFTMTPSGDSTFIGQPGLEARNMKGIEFVEVGGQTKLLAGSRSDNGPGLLYEIDPATGQEIGDPIPVLVPFSLEDPTLVETVRIIELATHPETGVLYGITQPDASDPLVRQLVTINPTTGVAALVGVLTTPTPGQSSFSGLAFVGFRTLPGDVDDDGDVDGNDFLLIQRGLGTTHDAGDLADWRANFGDTGAAAAAGAVPEPATIGLALLAIGAAMAARRGRA